jgi:UDP-N-acetylmuramoyl-tripeptide--D-alanyl-D-alanine ligase
VISWQASRVADVLGTQASDSSDTFTFVGTDTRSLQEGTLFVALVGERFDGHDYLEDACSRGAKGAVVRKGTPTIDGLVSFEVEDTTEALGMLARERRREVAGPVVAITGTNGKTSTKEMLACALSARWSVHATRANLNNLIGVPLTILDAPSDCDALVVEVGANQLGEIARLRDVVEPSVGVVTNVGHGHLEGFGSFEGLLQEKASLLAGVPLAVVGTDPPSLASLAERLADRSVTAGLDGDVWFSPDSWEVDDQVRGSARFGDVEVRLPVVGYHQLENLTLALAVARELEVDLSAAAAALGEVRLPPGRCEVLTSERRTVLQDAYNSNPGSLRALLKAAAAMRGERQLVVVLGTMLELGADSSRLHAEMADCVIDSDPHIVAAMGEFETAFERYAEMLGDRLITAADPETLGRLVAGRLSGDELVLVKGSRGVHLEHAIPYLLSTEETPCSTTS